MEQQTKSSDQGDGVMKAMVLRIGLLSSLTVMTACKVLITAPEGATVESASLAFRCDAGEQCEVDVVDVFFDETFTVTEDAAYRFMGWRRQSRGLCGGHLGDCPLSTTGFEGHPILLSLLESDDTFLLEPVMWAAPDDMPILEFRDIQGEPIVRDATGAPIGSWQGESESGALDVSVHFEGLSDTYTARIFLSETGDEIEPFALFFESPQDCEGLSDPYVLAENDGTKPLRAFYRLKTDENRFYIADPASEPEEITIRSRSPSCDELATITIFPPPTERVYPAIPTNFVLELPLTIDGVPGKFE